MSRLHLQDGLLTKQDQDLPPGGHVVGSVELIQIIEWFVTVMFVIGQEELPVLFEERDDDRKFIDPELLVLG